MNCTLYYHLRQKMYLAEIRGERYEAMRIEHEIDKHLDTCPECAGLSVDPLASSLFQCGVVVKNDNRHN